MTAWTADELERRWQAAPAPGGAGRVHLLVVRVGGGVHEVRPRIELSPEGGIAGDRWRATPDPEAQVSLIDRRVVDAIAGDDDARRHLHGDNVVVDLDLGVAALPVGARLVLGSAVVEITAKPHAGCSKFRARYGDEALRWINAREHRERRLRGVYARIVAAGAVAVGDAVTRV